MELLAYNIDPEAPILQTISSIERWAKELEKKVVKIEEEYKAHIAELKAKDPMTPPEQREARIAELQAFLATIALCLKDTQKLLEDTTSTWATIEEIDDLVVVHTKLQRNKKELDVVAAIMKDLPPLQHMMKMGENKILQAKLQ